MKRIFWLLFPGLLFINFKCYSQNSFAVEAGYGFFEGTHIRGKFNTGRLAVGLGLGQVEKFVPYSNGHARAYFLLTNYYFGKENRYQYRKNYFYADLEHIPYETTIKIVKVYAVSLGWGHDFYLTRHFGLNMQAGLFFSSSGTIEYKEVDYDKGVWILPIMPEASVRLFLRF